jgi:hypothetical protein
MQTKKPFVTANNIDLVHFDGDWEDRVIGLYSITCGLCVTNSEQTSKLCEGQHIGPIGSTCIFSEQHGRPKGEKARGSTLESVSRSRCHNTNFTLIADAYFTRVLFTSIGASRILSRVRGADDGRVDCRVSDGTGP